MSAADGQFTPKSLISKIPENRMDHPEILLSLTGPRLFGKKDDEEEKLRKELERLTMRINQLAEVKRIPNNTIDDSARDDEFEFFRVDTGMNINAPQGRIKRIRFFFSIFAGGKQSNDAYAVSGFPNDKIERITVLKGKIKLKLTKLLEIIPFTEAQTIADAIEIDLNPWEIDWAYNRLEIGFSEGRTFDLDWSLSADNVNQSFLCYFILKKRKSIKNVTGIARAVWEYEPRDKGAQEWLKRRFNKASAYIDSDERTVSILG